MLVKILILHIFRSYLDEDIAFFATDNRTTAFDEYYRGRMKRFDPDTGDHKERTTTNKLYFYSKKYACKFIHLFS